MSQAIIAEIITACEDFIAVLIKHGVPIPDQLSYSSAEDAHAARVVLSNLSDTSYIRGDSSLITSICGLKIVPENK